MTAKRLKVVVVDNTNYSKRICTWLAYDGYSVFEGNEASKSLRLIHRIKPDLIILVDHLKGMSIKLFIEIIHKDTSSKLLIMTRVNHYWLSMLHVDKERFKHVQLINEKQLLLIEVEKFLSRDTHNNYVEEAKKLLMNHFNISEENAYQRLRRKSMDKCKSIQQIAKKLVENHEHQS